ncbi:MAG: kelch repeat-containing protein, partial [Steroidobacteraceae bacterium]
ALLCAAMAGCGGGSVDHLPGRSTFSVGGTVSGLTGTLVLQNNDGDDLTVSNNGAFSFATPLTDGAYYSVTIATQPSGATCAVSNAGGAVSATVSTVLVQCNVTPAGGRWTWYGGASMIDQSGKYGSQGTAASANVPGAREAPSPWTDANGHFWLFGGYGYDAEGNSGLLNDLWQYEPAVGQWVWMGGASGVGAAGSYGTQGQAAAGNAPGAREAAAAWTDTAGQLWLFGGLSEDASQNSVEFNDLWKYQPATGQWTWMAGPDTADGAGSYGMQGVAAAGNVPPARAYPVTWVDSAGVLWLFGGAQYDASGVSEVFDDLWSYDPTTNLWTWVAGSSSPNATGNYGTLGTAVSTNQPGARAAAAAWVDAAGNLWLMGGYGMDQKGTLGELNDLWRYNPSGGVWTWVGGAASAGAGGTYGTQGTATAANMPGARVTATAWTDASGSFWLYGGYGYDQAGQLNDLSDLWKYDPSVGEWTWVSGSSNGAASGNYGTQGTSASGSLPGAREQAGNWRDAAGNLWLFGGYGFDSLGEQDDLDDLWSFAP